MGDASPILLGTVPTGLNPYAIAWSPDGRYIAVANYGDLTVQVFGVGGEEIGSPVVVGNSPTGVGWSPSGKYLTVPCDTDQVVKVFKFSPNSSLTQEGIDCSAHAPKFAGFTFGW